MGAIDNRGHIRLLVLTDTSVGGGGGTEQHLRMLIEGLDPDRYEVDVIQLGETAPRRDGPLGAATVYHLPTGRLFSSSGIKSMRELLKRVRCRRYHCILSFFESSDILAVSLSLLGGVKCILSSRRDTGFRYSAKLKMAYRYLDRCFRRIIVPSVAVEESLTSAGVPPAKIVRIVNGVELGRFAGLDDGALRRELGIAPQQVVVGNVALLRAEKDHETLLEALRILRSAGHDVVLVIVGDGPLRRELEMQRDRLGLHNHVHFLGMRNDVPVVLSGVDLFVLSSITEGMSNAILEAMAASLPVVATRVGGNPELVVEGESGYLVPPQDSLALAAAIERLAGDGVLRKQMGAAGRCRVEKAFSVQAMVEHYERVIEEVLEDQR